MRCPILSCLEGREIFSKEEKSLLYTVLESEIGRLEQSIFRALTEGDGAKATKCNIQRTMCIELQMKIHGVEKNNASVS